MAEPLMACLVRPLMLQRLAMAILLLWVTLLTIAAPSTQPVDSQAVLINLCPWRPIEFSGNRSDV